MKKGLLELQSGIQYREGTELTIATAVIIPTQSVHIVDTESDAASDILSTIDNSLYKGDLYLRSANPARIVTMDNADNVNISDNVSLDDKSFVHLVYEPTSDQYSVAGGTGVGGSSSAAVLLTFAPSVTGPEIVAAIAAIPQNSTIVTLRFGTATYDFSAGGIVLPNFYAASEVIFEPDGGSSPVFSGESVLVADRCHTKIVFKNIDVTNITVGSATSLTFHDCSSVEISGVNGNNSLGATVIMIGLKQCPAVTIIGCDCDDYFTFVDASDCTTVAVAANTSTTTAPTNAYNINASLAIQDSSDNVGGLEVKQNGGQIFV